jgi:HD-GYP domain-containing protein (c-di-GMP phosphodiesterase class II)
MADYPSKTDPGFSWDWGELGTSFLQSPPNILIPIKVDKKSQVSGYFALENQDLPASGQKYLNEITGTAVKASLAGLTVYFGPIQPMLQENYTRSLIMLAESIDRCDQSGHSQSTQLWAMRIAEHLQLTEDEIRCIGLAGKLHDIGKSVVSKEILTKPGPLSANEWEIIKQHPGYSAALMDPSPGLKALQPLVRWHHEQYQGGGYPDGLSGLEIPLGARILSVADAFSTMTTGRAYRSPIPAEIALDELIRCKGTQFDPELVDVMISYLTP